MKTLIIADLHEPPDPVLEKIEATLASEAPDRVVFLGDYFDQYNDTPADAGRMAKWLKASLADPRRTHLIGNHDASYLWAHDATYCPGFTWEKRLEIGKVLGKDLSPSRFVFHTWVDGWLLTHAGLSAKWYSEGTSLDRIVNWLNGEARAARKSFAGGKAHWFIAIGKMRGGMAPTGGILWCDFAELHAVPGVRQIFGHTPAECVRVLKDHMGAPLGRQHFQLCLDTNMGNGPQHYAVVEDGKVTVRMLQNQPTS
jgi:hypothetical protein